MSSAVLSRHLSVVPNLQRLVATCIERSVAGARAVAFWLAALLPLVVLGALATGSVNRYPAVLAGILVLNAICAVVGHGHTPGR